jgi:hypothetical protein
MAIDSQGENPLRLIPGADAVERVHANLAQVAEDLEIWKSTSVNTAYPYRSTIDPLLQKGNKYAIQNFR